MIPHVIEAKYVNDYKVWVRFNDGLAGEIDLSTELDGPIFEPLKDKAYFNQFSVRYNTISWENGADFAPEFLWEKVTQSGSRGVFSPGPHTTRHAGPHRAVPKV